MIEMMIEPDENHAEQSDEADQRAERHEKLAESFSFALARETGRSVRESGHIRGKGDPGKSDFFAAPSNENRPAEGYLL